ncbi:MAG: response regulator transcription factor [Pseudomonadota bacterium]
MSHQILIVEDDTDIAHLVQLQLRDIDCEGTVISDGEAAIEHLKNGAHYDAVILDVMLPGSDGLSVVRTLRSTDSQTPVLMLTAKSSELDRVLGLELGADDYMTKPFSSLELSARVKALLRRSTVAQSSGVASIPQLVRGGIRIDARTREVTANGIHVDLTTREFALLEYFMQNPDVVFTRSKLLKAVWGYSHDGYEHTVNTHINRLRAKIEVTPDDPKYIVTVWGVGYRFCALETDDDATRRSADAV